MKKKKNKFLLFVFSLWPGAGHMYMGFMKMGVSFMMGFLLSAGLVGITDIGVLAVFPITIYIYSFFHANNIGGLDDAQFAAFDDEYLFGIGEWDFDRYKLNRKNRNIAAVVCIVLGVSMLWNVGFGMLSDYVGWDNPLIRTVYYTVRNDVPKIVIAIAVIWFGVSLLRGKKKEFMENDRLIETDWTQKPMEQSGWKAEEERPDAQGGQETEEEKPDLQCAQEENEKTESQGVSEEAEDQSGNEKKEEAGYVEAGQ